MRSHPRTRPLPPPREVVDHDNAVKSIPTMRTFDAAEPTAPVEPVLYFPLNIS